MRRVFQSETLHKVYGKRRVVNGVSIEVGTGEVVGLLGPNGAGKTTTFYMMTGMIRPSAGRILLDGQDVTDLPMFRRARRGVGYLPQEASIFRKLTVEQNLMAILETLPLNRGQRRERLEMLLAELRVSHLKKSKAYTLSGGERRRVEIARALVTQPAFILLDEPFAGVDPIAVGDIQSIVQDLRARNIGVLITDHNVHETLSITDRAYLLYEGRILKSGTAEELAADEQVRRLYLGEHFNLVKRPAVARAPVVDHRDTALPPEIGNPGGSRTMMQLRQEVVMRQEMVQTPQQILRSELLQLPMMLLEARLKLEVEENPVLEFDEAGLDMQDETPEDGEKAESEDEVDWDEAVSDEENWNELLNEDTTPEYARNTPQSTQELLDIPRPQIQTLQETLIEQMQMDNQLSRADQRIGLELIGNLEDSGYLGVTVDQVAVILDVEPADVLRVLKRVQRYDPIGIAARDLQECLLVQMDVLAEAGVDHPVAREIIREHFENFSAKRYEVLARRLAVSLEEIKEAFLFISRLNPRPGIGEMKDKENYIIPDLVVEKVERELEDGSKDEEFVVSLVEGTMPSVRISRTYENMLRAGRTKVDKSVREFIVRKVESARWFINAIQQRRETMLKVMRSIVKLQMEFFLYGKEHIRPMILRDVAEDIEMDISTISRVTNRKYVQTEWGVFELKYFFSEGMVSDSGEDVSTKIIKGKLKDIVDAENKKRPLSDQKIAEMLAEDGYKVARRTVQKYREQMDIPVKRLRREI